MTPYRVGIVGLSWITADPAPDASNPVLGTAMPHTHGAALAAMDNVEVVAGTDIRQEACDNFVETWSPTWKRIATYLDYRDMLANEELDLVCIATPDHIHREVVEAAAASGVRAIFCEKPMSTTLPDADAIIETVERTGIPTCVDHTRRWMPQYVAAREVLRTGAIGDMAQIVIHLGGPRAMLWRNHSHSIDLFCYFAESDPAWVVAELEEGFEDYGEIYRGDGGRNPDLEPGVNAYFAFAHGVRGFLSGRKREAAHLQVELIGSLGRITIDDRGAVKTIVSDSGPVQEPIVPAATMGGIQAAIADLLQELETGRLNQCPPREARKTVALIDAILRSQAAGNTRVEVDG